MSILQQINQEISRIDRAKADIAAAIGHKGVQVPEDALLGEYPALVEQIEQASPAVLQSLMVTPSTTPQQIIPVAPVDGFNEVNVPAVTAAIDANIIPGNIKKDVPILGVTGTYEGGVAGPIYSLNNYVLDGTQAKAIDTGLRLMNNQDFPNGFFLSATLSLGGSSLANQLSYFRCRAASSPYVGFYVRTSSSTVLSATFDGNAAVAVAFQNKRVIVNIIKVPSYVYWSLAISNARQCNFSEVVQQSADATFCVGGEKDANNEWTQDRFGIGTIETLNIYKL